MTSEGERKLRLQAFRLLNVLVEHAPGILSHDELLDLVWGTKHLSASSLKQTISEVRQALGDDSSQPTFVETVHRRGYRFIASVERIEDENLATVSAGTPRVVPAAAGSTKKRSGSRLMLGVGLLATVAVIAILGAVFGGHDLQTVPIRKSIAIIGFTAPEFFEDWISTYISESLANEIMAEASMRVIPALRVESMKRELGLNAKESFEAQELEQMVTVLGADFVISGALGREDDSSPMSLKLCVTESLKPSNTLTISRTALPGDLSSLTRGIGTHLNKSLNPPAPTFGELPRSTPMPISTQPEAQRLYAIGWQRLRMYDGVAAITALEQASALDPRAPLIHSALAHAFMTCGYEKRAAASAETAMNCAENLPREQRLLIEAYALELSHEWQDAILKYSALQEFFPDSIEYALRLAKTQQKAGKAAEALAVINKLNQMAPSLSADPRIAVTATKILSTLGRFSEAETAASKAVDRAAETGASLVQAAALRERAWVHLRQGQHQAALDDIQRAKDLFERFGHESGFAGSLSVIAGIHFEGGNIDGARQTYLEALTVFRKIGDRRSEATVMHNLAMVQGRSGDLEGARTKLADTLLIKQDLEDVPGQAHILDTLAQIDRALGDPESARNRLLQAADIARETNDPLLEGRCIRSLGDLDYDEGFTEKAQQAYERAVELFREIAVPVEEGHTRMVLAQLAQEHGDADTAQRHLLSAVELYRSASADRDLAEALFHLGKVQKNHGSTEAAQAGFAEALELARKTQNTELVAEIEESLGDTDFD